ncbi:hypothetical protein B0A51_18791 [Rachicladosporium sp. CCFEE 5018]|nr:hypothetical protein B0A51_18791 [Rachicladosporium sp. CCFEE 5018]
MSQKYGKLDYSRCKISELRRFVLDRETPSSRTIASTPKLLKDDLIERLRELDQTKTFHHFADLPPEIRLLIYPYVLTYNETSKAHPAILQVSRLIYPEALAVLYDNTSFEIHIEALSATVHAGGLLRGRFKPAMLMERSRADKALEALTAMRKARHVKLVLCASANLQDHDYNYVYEIVRATTFHMADSTTLETLVIEVTDPETVTDGNDLRSALCPFALLPKRTVITVTGIGPDNGLFLAYEQRVRPSLTPKETRSLHKVLRDARVLLPRLETLAGGLGRPYGNMILKYIKDLYRGPYWMGPVDTQLVVAICNAMKATMRVAEEVEEALNKTMELQPKGWEGKMQRLWAI